MTSDYMLVFAFVTSFWLASVAAYYFYEILDEVDLSLIFFGLTCLVNIFGYWQAMR